MPFFEGEFCPILPIFAHFCHESAIISRFGPKLARQAKIILDLEAGARDKLGFEESNVFVKNIAMTNRHRTEAMIVPDDRAFGTGRSRDSLRNRRRAECRADRFEERKT